MLSTGRILPSCWWTDTDSEFPSSSSKIINSMATQKLTPNTPRHFCSQGSLCVPPTHWAANVSVHMGLSPGDPELFEGKDSFHSPGIQHSGPSGKCSAPICTVSKPLSFPGCLAGKFPHKQVGHRKTLLARYLGSMKADFWLFCPLLCPWTVPSTYS